VFPIGYGCGKKRAEPFSVAGETTTFKRVRVERDPHAESERLECHQENPFGGTIG
jgi:hypothetical protein